MQSYQTTFRACSRFCNSRQLSQVTGRTLWVAQNIIRPQPIILCSVRAMRPSHIQGAQPESTRRPGDSKPCSVSRSLPVYSQQVQIFKDHPPSFPRLVAKAVPFAYSPPQRGRSPSRLSDASTEEMCVDKALTGRSSSEPSLIARPAPTPSQSHVRHDCMVTPRRSELAQHGHHAPTQRPALQEAKAPVIPPCPQAAQGESCARSSPSQADKPKGELIAGKRPSALKMETPSASPTAKHEARLSWLGHMTPLWQRTRSSPELAKRPSHVNSNPRPGTNTLKTYASNFTRAKESSLNAAKGALRHALAPCKALASNSAPSKIARPAPTNKGPSPKPKAAPRGRAASHASVTSAKAALAWRSLKDENAALQAWLGFLRK